MTIKPIVGFHVAVAGNRNGIGEHWQRLADANIPSCVVSIADRGAIEEFCSKSAPNSIAVFRYNRDDNGNTLEHGINYSESVFSYLDRYLNTQNLRNWSHLKHEKVWLAVMNEPNQDIADDVFAYSLELAKKLNSMGIKAVVCNWATGTPRSWDTPSGIKLLAYSSQNRDKCMIGIHEYSLSDNLLHQYPYLVGRMNLVVETCHKYDILPPRFCAKEFGYHYNHIPDPSSVFTDLDKLYSGRLMPYQAECVRAFWYLGGEPEYQRIDNKVQKLIAPMTDWLMRTNLEVRGGEGMVSDSLYNVGKMAVDEHPSYVGVIPAEAQPSLIRAILANGMYPVSSEIKVLHEGVVWTVQAGRKNYNTKSEDVFFFWKPGMQEAITKSPFVSSSTP